MIRVLIIDDHSAIRTGLEAALKHSPDVVPVGAGSDELWPLFKRTAPDLVLLDYHLPGQDGLILCHRLKNTTLPPRVIIYSGLRRRVACRRRHARRSPMAWSTRTRRRES